MVTYILKFVQALLPWKSNISCKLRYVFTAKIPTSNRELYSTAIDLLADH